MRFHQPPKDIRVRQLRLARLDTLGALGALQQGLLVAKRADPVEWHVSLAHQGEVLAEEGGVFIVVGGQAHRHEDDVALLRELADAREDYVSDPTAEVVVVVASVGEERLHGVDQEVVVHQAGGFVGGQELSESFKDGVFSRAGEAVEDNDYAAGGSLDRLVFADEVQ